MNTISVDELATQERQIEQEIAEKQELLEALRKTRLYIQSSGKNGHDQRPRPAKLKLKFAPPGYGHNTRLVRDAIKQMTRNYTIRDIRRALSNSGTPLSDKSITTVMIRLKRNTDITEIRKGSGRKPSLFRKP